MVEETRRRRSLTYIRLAAHLAGLPPHVSEVAMSAREIEDLLDHDLPTSSRFPSWWRNDHKKMHSRAWLSAGWEVSEAMASGDRVVFVRTDGGTAAPM